MRTLPSFRYLAPESIEEAVKALSLHGPRAAVLAGGVDLVVRMKERSATPEVVVDLTRLPELTGVRATPGGATVGALTPIASLRHEAFPILDEVASGIGGQAHRVAATVGGNLLAGLRCFAFGQTLEWREGNGRCLREGGEVCHADRRGDACVATHQTDLAPALAVLDAEVSIAGPDGLRRIGLGDLYRGDGDRPFRLGRGEILTAIHVPWPAADRRVAYRRLSLRRGIDRPILGIAASGRIHDEELRELRVAATGVGPAPGFFAVPGAAPVEEAARHAAALASERFEPSPAIREDLWWRREVLPVLTRRAVEDLTRAPAPRSLPGEVRAR